MRFILIAYFFAEMNFLFKEFKMFYLTTYATHNERYYKLLAESRVVKNLCATNLKWNGFYDKVIAVVKFSETLNKDDIVCFIDGFDSVILSTDPLREIPKKFLEYKCGILFSSDHVLNIVDFAVRNKIFGVCHSRLLNSGMYVGYAQTIIDFWKDMKKNDDDQIYASQKCILNKNINLKIDKTCHIFLNIYQGRQFQIENNRIKLKYYNTYPCIISAVGYQNMNNLLLKVGFDNHNLPNLSPINKNKIKYYSSLIKTFWFYLICELIFCIIFVLSIIVFSKLITK